MSDLMSNAPFLSNCTADTVHEAAEALKAGHLVAFPTETVYGLGGDARNPEAVKRIYEVKGRPTDHPLIVHISSINQLDKWASEISEYAIALARAFWPGPMTLILKRTHMAGNFITGGQESIGLFVPSDPIALAVIQEFEKISDSVIAAPSANPFGQVSPTSSLDVYEELGDYFSDSDIVLDGENSLIGIESTIIDCKTEHPRILRPGFIGVEDVENETGIKCETPPPISNVKFSGSFERHYAPKCKVKLHENIQHSDLLSHQSGFLALGDVETPSGMLRLASPQSLEEFAQILYSTFREADRLGMEFLVVSPPSNLGFGVAIRERIEKAAAGR
jgi:L-threonylcarbamoyladenylate synthase